MSRKIVLITGASRGLGRSMALHLAERGFDVLGTYRSEESEATQLEQALVERGARAAMLRYDALDDAPAAFADRVRTTLRDSFGRDTLESMVNNAGIGHHAPLAETAEADFDRLVGINLKAPLFLTQALLPDLVDGGRVLFVSTGLARFSIPGYGAYAATKGAVEVMTRYFAKELGARGIRVNVLAPGAIETDFSGGVVRDNPEVNRHIADTTALGRVGQADDVGAAVAAMLSDELGWMNGTRLEVSGGQSL